MFRLPWLVNAAAMLVAAALMFAPVVFVHPLRVVRLRGWTIAASVAWFGFAGGGDLRAARARLWVKGGLVATALYFSRCRSCAIRPGRITTRRPDGRRRSERRLAAAR